MLERDRRLSALGDIVGGHVRRHALAAYREGFNGVCSRYGQLRCSVVDGGVSPVHRFGTTARDGFARDFNQPHPHEGEHFGLSCVHDAHLKPAGDVFPGLQRRRTRKPLCSGKSARRDPHRKRSLAWHHRRVLASLYCGSHVAGYRHYRDDRRRDACNLSCADARHAPADGICCQGKRQEFRPHLRRAEDQARRC